MQCMQGKPLVGPLTLAEGEEVFVRCMSLVDRYGAAAWIALIDEQESPTHSTGKGTLHNELQLCWSNPVSRRTVL